MTLTLVFFFLTVAKLAVVGFLFWAAMSRMEKGSMGVVVGVGAAIAGFTLGVSQGASSREGQVAMEEQSRLTKPDPEDF